MWIRVATSPDSVRVSQGGNKYTDGQYVEEYYFDESVAEALDADGFLPEMWKQFDAMFDWGDCDFFEPDKCQKLLDWIRNKLKENVPSKARSVYEVLLRFAEIAICNNTGIYFDF